MDWRPYEEPRGSNGLFQVSLTYFLSFHRQANNMDMIPLVYKCIEYYFKSELEASESLKTLNKIIALQNPTQSLYQMIMSNCLAIVAGHLSEYSNEN